MQHHARILVLGGVVAVACSLGEIDYTGKTCPCPTSWVCSGGTCQRSPQSVGSEGKIRVSNLKGSWATPNSIFWEWDMEGDRDDFGRLEITVTSTTLDAGGATTWTSIERPELGRMYLETRGGAEISSRTTLTEGHAPDTDYRAVLTAYDSAGGKTVTNEASKKTAVALSNKVTLFSETRPPGYPIPSMLQIATGCGAAGSSNCIRYDVAADPEQRDGHCTSFGCPQNLRWDNLQATTTAIAAESFDYRPYLELHLRSTGSTISYYSLIWLQTNDPQGGCTLDEKEDCKYKFTSWTFKPSETYRRLQIPLRVLQTSTGALLTHRDLMRGAFGFNVYASWSEDQIVDIDEVAIWY